MMQVPASLSAYGAALTRVQSADGASVEYPSEGGQLAGAYERIGRGPLLAALHGHEAIELVDGDLRVRVQALGTEVRLTVQLGEVGIVDERLSLLGDGPVFRPDPSSRVGVEALSQPQPVFVVDDHGVALYTRGQHGPGEGARRLLGTVPVVDPASLGSAAFRKAHGVKWAYVAGAMAGGIGSAELVLAMARAGLVAFFGAGGLPVPVVEENLKRIAAEVDGVWGANLLHNPNEPAVEEQTVDLYLKYGVPRVSASAYMTLTAAVVRYRLTGIHAGPDGRAVCPNAVFAKVSRPEVAERFLRPAPDKLLAELQARGVLTAEQVALARTVPVAEDITAEADSGGHTDRRPLVVLLPLLQALRDRVQKEQGYAVPPRIGAAGGIGTPTAAWAAFAMGADYVLTGSVNQATLEAGTSELTKQLLTEAAFTDVASGPAPDMFELGAHVQVLSRGTMYAKRAQQLYEVYKAYESMEAIPEATRSKIEKQLFKASLEEVWVGTESYWAQRDPAQVERAHKDGRHKMALTFRWYLGMTSRWARTGDPDRKMDFQVWCGPAMGAFNAWVEGTELAPASKRSVVAIAEALMYGAAVKARETYLRTLVAAV